MSKIDPSQFQSAPTRPICEIAKDLLQFPLERDPVKPFDPSQRVAKGDMTQETLLQALSQTAQLSAALDTRRKNPSVVHKKMMHSQEAVTRFVTALESMADTNRFDNDQRTMIVRSGIPIFEIFVRREEERLAELTRKMESGEAAEEDILFNQALVKAGHTPVDFQSPLIHDTETQYVQRLAGNIRGPVRALMEELGRAMNVGLESKITLS